MLLRGRVSSEDTAAGPARESAILRACEGDRWDQKILTCLGSTTDTERCTKQLTDQQRDNLRAKLDTWTAQYGANDEGDESTPETRYVDCAELVDDVASYAPPLDDTSPERDWQIPQRKVLVEKTCNTEGWSEATRECLLAGRDPVSVEACLRAEDPAKLLVHQLTDLDRHATLIADAKKKPASISCDRVAVAHYGDARWKDRLTKLAPAERRRQIASSRAALAKRCKTERWSDTIRACIVTADDPQCYPNAASWSYPALIAAPLPNLPVECGLYKAAIERLAQCDAVPQVSRDAMKQAFDQASAGWAALPAAEAQALAAACKAGADAIDVSFAACSSW